MKISMCCFTNIIKHSITKARICSHCGYQGSEIEIDRKKYKREKTEIAKSFKFVIKKNNE